MYFDNIYTFAKTLIDLETLILYLSIIFNSNENKGSIFK